MASKIVVNLDTSKEVFLNSKCKQNDDLILECNIFENGLAKDLTNCSIVIQALKADKTYIIQNTDITKNKNNFIANLVRDFTRVSGETEIEIVLTESSKQNTTFSFCLEVVGSVIRGAVESKNTVTILENLQDKIEEAGVVKQETEQLIEKGGAATKGDIQEVNAQLDNKANKNEIFSMANMGQDVKEAMTGGSVAVVGKGAVLTENIVPRQITPYTTNFFNVVNFMDLSSLKFVNQFVGSDGVIKSDELTVSMIFKVEPNTKYKLKLNDIVGNRGVVISSSSDNFAVGETFQVLSSTALNKNIISFISNEDTNFVFIYFNNNASSLEYYNNMKSNLKLYKNEIPVNEDEYIKKENLPHDILYKSFGSVKAEYTDFFNFYNLLLNNADIIKGNCYTNGVVEIPGSGTSLIASVSPDTEYYLKLPSISNRAYILSSNTIFEDGKTYEMITPMEVDLKLFKFTTLSNTTSVFVYFYNTFKDFNLDEFSLTTDVKNIDVDYSIKKELLPNNEIFVAKKILTIGDSITAINEGDTANWDRSWRKYFKEIFRPSLFSNVAVPGATWRDKNGTVYDGNPVSGDNPGNVIGNQIEKILRGKDPTHPNYVRVAEYDDYDIIIIACGTNDDSWTIPSDSEIETQFYTDNTAITDLKTLDRKTWAGAMRYAIDTLRRLYPNAKIYVSTPIQRTGNKYNIISAKNQIIKNICKRLSIEVIDSMVCGIYDMTCPNGDKSGDFNDGLHLSPQGAIKLGKFIANEVKNKYY